jgi:FkbM family methyltransferase
MPTSRLRQLLKFIRVFGLSGGIRLWCALLLRTSRNTPSFELQLPNLPAPIRLRPTDLPIFWQIMVMRENDFASLPQARKVSETYRNILSSGRKPVIVDCGGHVGLSAVWFASQYPEAKIYTVEPDASNFAMLQQNTKAYSNVSALNGGIWNRSCHLEILNPQGGSASFRLQETPEVEQHEKSNLLRSYTIDEISTIEPGNQLFLVKIDIEGAEADLFREPAPWFQSAAMVIIELHDWLFPGLGTSRSFFRRLGESNFEVALHGENLLLFRTPELHATADQMADAGVPVTTP